MKRHSILIAGALAICAAQAASSWFLKRDPFLPSPPSLSTLPVELAGWTRAHEETVEPDAIALLGPDDFLARVYTKQEGEAELFVAYYKTQLREKNAHDPKVCLPGAGWNPLDSHVASIPVPGSRQSFPVLYYRIQKAGVQRVVLYWFQTLSGVYTFEQQLRLHRILDAISLNRTDMAFVRIIVPVTSEGLNAANANATDLAQAAYLGMTPYFSEAAYSPKPDTVTPGHSTKSGS